MKIKKAIQIKKLLFCVKSTEGGDSLIERRMAELPKGYSRPEVRMFYLIPSEIIDLHRL
jgi:hypothetical protein